MFLSDSEDKNHDSIDSAQDHKSYQGISGTPITYLTFKRAVEAGCCICASPIDLKAETEKQTVVFYSDDDVVCQDCQSLPFVQAMFYSFHV